MENVMNIQQLSSGDTLSSPAGRSLKVADVFVPRSNREKSQSIPSQFRNFNRKVVVFENGSIAPLKDIKYYYTLIV